MRQTFYLIYLIAGAGLVWVSRDYIIQTINQFTKKKDDRPFDQSIASVDMLKVTKSPIKRTLSFAGVVANRKLVKIKPERGGQINFLNQNSSCKKGELLVEFVNDFEKATVLKQQALFKRADANLKRYQSRINQNPGSASDAERLTYETEANVAKAELLKSEAELAKTKIFAPFDGRVGIYSYGISEGSHVNPNDVIVNYASGDTDLVVDFFVSESDIPYLKEGKSVTAVLILYGKQVLLKGQVERINQGSDASLSLQVRVGLHLSDVYLPGPILPGYGVKILSSADTDELVPAVDERALQEIGDSWYLTICVPTEDQDQNGRRIYITRRQRVETTTRSGGKVAVNLPEGLLYTSTRLLDSSKVTDKKEDVPNKKESEESGAKESGAKESGAKESGAKESGAKESGAINNDKLFFKSIEEDMDI